MKKVLLVFIVLIGIHAYSAGMKEGSTYIDIGVGPHMFVETDPLPEAGDSIYRNSVSPSFGIAWLPSGGTVGFWARINRHFPAEITKESEGDRYKLNLGAYYEAYGFDFCAGPAFKIIDNERNALFVGIGYLLDVFYLESAAAASTAVTRSIAFDFDYNVFISRSVYFNAGLMANYNFHQTYTYDSMYEDGDEEGYISGYTLMPRLGIGVKIGN